MIDSPLPMVPACYVSVSEELIVTGPRLLHTLESKIITSVMVIR